MKILLIRFSSIGDIVLTSPVIRCIKQQIEGVELHVLTKEAFASLYTLNPSVDKVFTIKKRISEVLPELKQEGYDHIIDLHHNFRSLGVRMKLRRPSSSFPKLNLKKWLLVKFKIRRMPDIHIVDRYFEAVKPLGVSNDEQGLDFFIHPRDEVDLAGLPGELKDGYYSIVIGGKHNTKILPPVKVAEIIENLALPAVLLGGEEDRERGEEIIHLSRGKVFNFCGEYSLGQSASLVRQARAVITNDTGLMHIAAAFKKKIISVWGNTVPELGMYPYLPQHPEHSFIAEVEGLSCRPCSKIGFEECPKKHFKCMMEQDSRVIAKAAEEGDEI